MFTFTQTLTAQIGTGLAAFAISAACILGSVAALGPIAG